MKKIKILILLTILLNISNIRAGERKIHFIPVLNIDAEPQLVDNYTGVLKEKLILSGLFSVEDSEALSFEREYDDEYYAFLRNAVYGFCNVRNLKSVIYGFIKKTGTGLEVNMYWYSGEGDKMISTFNDYFTGESDLKESAVRCAVEFVTRVNSIESVRFFAGSVFMPGLGQIMMKEYVKGSLIMGGIGFAIYSYLNAGSKKSFEDDFKIKVIDEGDFLKYIYLLNNEEIPFSSVESYRQEYNGHNNDINRKKTIFKITAGLIYLANIVDVVVSNKDFNNRLKTQQKLSLDVYKTDEKMTLNLNFRF